MPPQIAIRAATRALNEAGNIDLDKCEFGCNHWYIGKVNDLLPNAHGCVMAPAG
jgi:hypothetical protein